MHVRRAVSCRVGALHYPWHREDPRHCIWPLILLCVVTLNRQLMRASRTPDTKLDSWALGCLFAEMIAARVIFRGKDSLDQLIQIMRKLGTPTVDQLMDINPALDPASIATYANLRTVARSWGSIMGHTRFTPDMQELLTSLLEWSPKRRISASRALNAAYFQAP